MVVAPFFPPIRRNRPAADLPGNSWSLASASVLVGPWCGLLVVDADYYGHYHDIMIGLIVMSMFAFASISAYHHYYQYDDENISEADDYVCSSLFLDHEKMHRDFCNFRSHSRGSLYARDSSGSRDQRTPRCQQQPPNNQGLQPEGLKISKGQLPSEWAVRLGLRWLQSTSVGITSKNCNLRRTFRLSREAGSPAHQRRFHNFSS